MDRGYGIYGAVEKAFDYLAREHGIPKRTGRRLPEMFRYLGWCSWDAFYTDISEEKVRAKARKLYDIGALAALGHIEKSAVRRINSSVFEFKPLPEELLYIQNWYADE